MQVKKQQLEPDIEQQTGSKLGKEYFKAVYCHPDNLTYMQSTYGEGNGLPLQYSCLENPMDGGAWKATVHGVTVGQTWLRDFTFSPRNSKESSPTPQFESISSLALCFLHSPTLTSIHDHWKTRRTFVGKVMSLLFNMLSRLVITFLPRSKHLLMHWRRKWQHTSVFLPGESQGWGSLVGCYLWGHTESDMTEVT